MTTEAVAFPALGGRPKAELVADLMQLTALPAGARESLWNALGPALPEPIPGDVEGVLDRFIQKHGVDSLTLSRGLKAARTLVRQAATLDADADSFGADLTALAEGRSEITDSILPGYERAKAAVRAELASATVAEHGRLLESVRWRLDLLTASDRVAGLRVPVVTVTLCYREGQRREQISLQVLPDVMNQLRELADRVLGR